MTAPSRVAAAALVVAALCRSASAGELGDLMRDALQHPGVAARTAQVRAAQSDLDAAGDRYWGAGALSADQANYESSRFLGVLNPGGFANPDYARSQLRFGASYSLPVDLFGAIAANREAARENLALAQLAERQEALLKLHQTLTVYVRLQALQTQADALEVQHRRVATTIERVAAQVQAGSLGPTDLKLAQSERARVEAEQVGIAGERDELMAQLDELAGRHLRPARTALELPAWQAGDAAQSLPARMADSAALAADAQARVQRRALLPALSAGGEYYQYDGGGHGQDTWSVGARISMPLDLGAYRKVSGAEAQAEAARDAREAARRKAGSELVALRAAYDSAKADIEALRSEVDYREQVVAVQDELAKAGAVTVEDSLRHLRDRAEAEARLAQMRSRAAEAWSAAQVLAGTPPDVYIRQFDSPSIGNAGESIFDK